MILISIEKDYVYPRKPQFSPKYSRSFGVLIPRIYKCDPLIALNILGAYLCMTGLSEKYRYILQRSKLY